MSPTETLVEVQLVCAICGDPLDDSACDDRVLCSECSQHHCGDCYLAHTETLGDRFISRWSA